MITWISFFFKLCFLMTLGINYNTLQTNKQPMLLHVVHGSVHWSEGRILETLIHLIFPVRCVDKSKAEWDEDNKVRRWPGIMPLHISLCLFPISLCLYCIILFHPSYLIIYLFVSFLPVLQCRHICLAL